MPPNMPFGGTQACWMRQGNSKEAQRLERLAELHREQRRNLLRNAARLKTYYEKKGAAA